MLCAIQALKDFQKQRINCLRIQLFEAIEE